jgi:hydrogenase maturation protein HypF
MVLRLGRGFAPLPVPLRGDVPPLLALGGHLKNAPAITVAAQAVLAPQLGDLDDPATLQAHRTMVQDLSAMHGISPVAVVCDAHPDYATTEEAERTGKKVIRVPHHLAHVVAAMAEHGLDGPVLGIAWDGTGYGDDGTVWGGEMLVVEGARWRRFARLHPFRLPGGDAAAREPDRTAVGMLAELFGTDLAAWPPELKHEMTESLLALCRSGINAPLTSSAGRLFDAVAALLGICRRNSFEGEAAVALESLATAAPEAGAYPVAITDKRPLELDWRPAIRALLHDVGVGVAAATIAARFHDAMVHGAVALARRSGLADIVLTGGCFQSWLLTERLSTALRAAGLNVFIHRRVPPGDGGLALGQLEWARRVLEQ